MSHCLQTLGGYPIVAGDVALYEQASFRVAEHEAYEQFESAEEYLYSGIF